MFGLVLIVVMTLSGHLSDINEIYNSTGIDVQVILFEIDCADFYTNLQELFCQLMS